MVASRIPRSVGATGLLLAFACALADSPSNAAAQDQDQDQEQEQEAEQEFPSIGGGEFRFGLAFPDDADAGWSLGADLDLGAIFGGFRVFAGYTGLLGVDVDRALRGEPLRGDLTAHGLRGGTRVEFLRDQTVVPYASAAILVYRPRTRALEAEDADVLRDLYGGNRLGGSLALGATYPLEATGQAVAVLELRRAYISAVGNWSLDAGFRFKLLEESP